MVNYFHKLYSIPIVLRYRLLYFALRCLNTLIASIELRVMTPHRALDLYGIIINNYNLLVLAVACSINILSPPPSRMVLYRFPNVGMTLISHTPPPPASYSSRIYHVGSSHGASRPTTFILILLTYRLLLEFVFVFYSITYYIQHENFIEKNNCNIIQTMVNIPYKEYC